MAYHSSEYMDFNNSGALDLSKNSRSPEQYYALSPDYNRETPTMYPERRESPKSPHQTFPNFATLYPGAEHLSHYVLQAAYQQQQQLLLQNPETIRPQDAVSEAGSRSPQNMTPMPIYPLLSPTKDGKVTRPFKAYPKDPLSLTAGFDSMLDTDSTEKYNAFRERMLEQIRAANGGQATVSNPKMRRTVNTNHNNNNCYEGEEGKEKTENPNGTTSYTERRKKNNAAAKKSRDRRRIKEDEIAIRAAFLERENIELKFQLAALKKQS